MSQGSRPERIGDQIRAEISQLLARELKDPGIGFVTLTRVHVTPDLQLARVYYTCLGDASRRESTRLALQRASAYMRRQLGQRLRLRRAPVLEFLYDESIEGMERIERLLQEIHAAEASPAATDEPDDDSRDEGGDPPPNR